MLFNILHDLEEKLLMHLFDVAEAQALDELFDELQWTDMLIVEVPLKLVAQDVLLILDVKTDWNQAQLFWHTVYAKLGLLHTFEKGKLP